MVITAEDRKEEEEVSLINRSINENFNLFQNQGWRNGGLRGLIKIT